MSAALSEKLIKDVKELLMYAVFNQVGG